MTRINSSINVKRLTDEHLLAEHREIKRITDNFLKRKKIKNGFDNLPVSFTLGKGHVLFFINKGKFTHKRYLEIRGECLNRGFSVTDYSKNWDVYDEHYNDYDPTINEHVLLIERITERLLLTSKQFWHYYGEKITKHDSIKLLTS